MNNQNNSTKQTDFSFSTFLENLKDPNAIYQYYLKKRVKRLIEEEKAARFFNNTLSFYDLINKRK